MDRTQCAPVRRNHFHGNGTCDAMRTANKHADSMDAMAYTGMEAEIAPYTASEQQMTARSAAALTPQSRTVTYTNDSGAAVPYANGTAAGGYDNPEYGPDHVWTSAEEEGLNSMPQESFNDPLSADEAARNSWRALLARNVGRSVLVRFLLGTQNLVVVEGELYEVGTDYIVIYQPAWDSHITADLYSVKFVEFREPPGQQLS